MYKSFFGLTKNPFNVNPDPAYLYLTPQVQQSLDELSYGIETRKGLLLLTGEAGTGKTTLVNHLLLWLGHQRARTAFIFNSHLDSAQLFDFILSDFEIPSSPQMRANPLLAFNDWLLARYRAHELVVLIVDEAQGLPAHVLEEIRLLSNMETPDEKLLQILLVGQPELETKLKRPDLRQLQQRIALRCKTAPLSLQETQHYIETRLHTAGSPNSAAMFAPDAVEAVHVYSRGIARVTNLLCDNALICAYVEQQRTIHASIIADAARELQFDELKPVSPRLKIFPQPAGTPELRSLVAKIREVTGDEERGLPVSVPPVASVPPQVRDTFVDQLTSPRAELHARATAKEWLAPQISYPLPPKNPPRLRGWKQDRSGTFAASILADLRHATGATVGFVTSLQVQRTLAKLSREIRATSGPKLATAREILRHAVEVGAAACKQSWSTQALRMKRRWWWRQNSLVDLYRERCVGLAALAALLFLLARRVYPTQSWHHPALLVLGFALFLVAGLSSALAISILVRERLQLQQDAAHLYNGIMSWLRAPMDPVQARALGSMGGKIQSGRRA